MGSCGSKQQVANSHGTAPEAAAGPVVYSFAEKQRQHVIFTGSKSLGRPLVFGHRGGSKKYPENTIQAFLDAWENGADGCEMDVFLTKDYEVIVFHDDNTKRTIEGDPDLTIVEASWKDQLKDLRFKKELKYDRETLQFDDNYPITLLKDVLTEFKGKKSKAGLPFVLNIELKPASPIPLGNDIGKYVARLVREYDMEEHVSVVAFDPLKLLDVERIYPGLNTGWQYDDDLCGKLGNANVWFEQEPTQFGDRSKFEANKGGVMRFLMENATLDNAIGASIVDLEHTVIDTDTIAKFQAKGFAVGSFTFFPTDLSSVHRHPPEDPEGAYEDSKRILRQVVKRNLNWIETDSVELSLKALREIHEELQHQEQGEQPK